jgi:hypothetical protein
MASLCELITKELTSCPGVEAGEDAARGLEDVADAQDAVELMRLRDDRGRASAGGGAAV